jgi:hypothetical protein
MSYNRPDRRSAQDVQEVIEYLRGSCAYFDTEEFEDCELEQIYEEIFNCDVCGWWDEVTYCDDDGICFDCALAEDDGENELILTSPSCTITYKVNVAEDEDE